MIITPACPEDLAVILAMRQEASDWLHARGIDQWRRPWPNREAMLNRIAASIAAGETWMIYDDSGNAAATIAVDEFADPQLWTPEEIAQPSMYLHRFIVRRAYAGIGAEILNWASAYAARQGKHWVRVDVWTHNTALHTYYRRHGFQHVRTIESDYPSGALFQRRARADDWDDSGLIREQPHRSASAP